MAPKRRMLELLPEELRRIILEYLLDGWRAWAAARDPDLLLYFPIGALSLASISPTFSTDLRKLLEHKAKIIQGNEALQTCPSRPVTATRGASSREQIPWISKLNMVLLFARDMEMTSRSLKDERAVFVRRLNGLYDYKTYRDKELQQAQERGKRESRGCGP